MPRGVALRPGWSRFVGDFSVCRGQVARPGVGSNQPVLAGTLPHGEIFTVVLSRCAVSLGHAHTIRSHIPGDIAALFDVGDVECEVRDTVAARYPQIISNGIPPVHGLAMRRKIYCVRSVSGNQLLQVPGIPILRPIMADFAYGGSRASWSGRFSTGGFRLPYCASHAFLHSCPHRTSDAPCSILTRNVSSNLPACHRTVCGRPLHRLLARRLTIQTALQSSESPQARCPHARIRLHLQRLQKVL